MLVRRGGCPKYGIERDCGLVCVCLKQSPSESRITDNKNEVTAAHCTVVFFRPGTLFFLTSHFLSRLRRQELQLN